MASRANAMHKRLKVFKKRYVAHHRAQVRHRIKKISRRPAFAVPVVAVMLLLMAAATAAMIFSGGRPTLVQDESNIVIVSHDHQEQIVPTRTKTVGELLDKLNIKLGERDVVEPAVNTPITEDNFRVNVYRALPVTIYDGGSKTVALSAASTGRSIARQVGIPVFPEDNVLMIPTSDFTASYSIGGQVVIKRATPINLNLYGTFVGVRTQATTVGGLLKEKHIVLAEGDTVQPAAETPITPNQQVFVIRKGVQIQVTEELIAPPTETVEDRNLSFGTTATRQQGVPGKKLVTYQFDTVTGERRVIQEVVAASPVPKIVARGTRVDIPGDKTAIMAAAGIPPDQYTYANFVISHESGWRPNALNASGCAGLGQACPGSKLAAVCPNWQGDPICQMRFFNGYASRYGGWAGAYNFWLSHHYW